MYQQLVLSILFTVILVNGVTIARQEGMLLWPLAKMMIKVDRARKWKRLEPIKWFKIVLICAWCMPSIYSAFGIFFSSIWFGYFDTKLLFLYPVIVCAGSVLSGVIWNLIQKTSE